MRSSGNVLLIIQRFSLFTIVLLAIGACRSLPDAETALGSPSAPSSGAESGTSQPDQEAGRTENEGIPGDSSAPPTRPGADVERVTPRPLDEAIDALVRSMTLAEKTGQLIVPAILDVGIDIPTRIGPEIERMLEMVRPGGIVLFGPNLETPEQTRELVSALQAQSPIPLIIAVDQEGGLVDRLASSGNMGATRIPSAARVGSTGDPQLAYELARVVARELRSLGINMNLAPVADVMTNAANPVIGSRAFGSDPDLVAEMVASTVHGFHDEGVTAVLKHFPGHGDTKTDTHQETAVVPHSIERLRRVELVPFVRGIESGADVVMTGHVSVPSIQGDNVPATFSTAVVTDLLRNQMGFDGVVLTDALMMGALVNYYRADEIALRALVAGSDLLLRPADPVAAHRQLITAVESGRISEERINESVRRILRLKFVRSLMLLPVERDDLYRVPRRLVPAHTTMATAEHLAIVDEIRRKSQ